MGSSIHEIDIPLTPNVAAAFSPTRVPAAELHVNPWVLGSKGTSPSVQVGTAASIAAGIGLIVVAQRPTALSNAPAELVLGDVSGPWVINLAEGAVVTNNTVTNVSLISLP